MNIHLSLLSKILLVLCLVAVLISANWAALNARRVMHLTLATGDVVGESYVLGQAIGGLLIALTTLPEGSFVGLQEWWQRWKQQTDERKLLADQYIDATIRCMEVPIDLGMVERQTTSLLISFKLRSGLARKSRVLFEPQ